MRTPKGLPTGSRLQLAMACAASQVLPVIDSEYAAGEAGREKHRALGLTAGGHPPAAESVTPETYAWLERMLEEEAYIDLLRGAAVEPAFAFDVSTQTARYIGDDVGWQYGAGPSEFAGAMDFVRVLPGEVVVIDLKTGQGDTPHPSRNHQMRFGALAAARVAGLDSARIGLLVAPEGRKPFMQWDTLEAYDLAEVAVELTKLAERIGWAREAVAKGKVPHLTRGEHCKNCKARFGCPAQASLLKRAVGMPEEVVMDMTMQLSPPHAADAYRLWRAVKAMANQMGAALYAYAAEQPFEVDGEVFGPTTKTTEEIDAEKAWFVLESNFGADVAKESMRFETSKAGVGRGMKLMREKLRGWPVDTLQPKGVREAPKGARGTTIKGLEEHALKLLREAGAVEKKTTTVTELHTPKPPLLAE